MPRKFNFNKLGGKAAGLAVGAAAVKMTDKIAANLNPNIKTFGQLAIGLVGPGLMKAKPGSIIECAGDGMAAVATYKLLDRVPGLSGIDDLDESIGAGGYVVDHGVMGEVDDDDDLDIGNIEDLDESIGEVDEDDLDID